MSQYRFPNCMESKQIFFARAQLLQSINCSIKIIMMTQNPFSASRQSYHGCRISTNMVKQHVNGDLSLSIKYCGKLYACIYIYFKQQNNHLLAHIQIYLPVFKYDNILVNIIIMTEFIIYMHCQIINLGLQYCQYFMSIPYLSIALFALIFVQLGFSQQVSKGYVCSVANCQICSFPNFCGVCNNNFILQINITTSAPYCQQVVCNIANCQYCYQNNICASCAAGYFVNGSGVCSIGVVPNQCTLGCLACNSTACLVCQIGYNLQNGGCFPSNGNAITNCLSYFTGYRCQLCQNGYIVNPAYQCVPNPGFVCNSIPNCAECQGSSTQTQCTICQPAYQLNQQNNCVAQTCSVLNCLSCNQQACEACFEGFFLSNGQCSIKYYQCNVQNCLYCKQANVCGQCAPGYQVILNIQNKFTFGSSCQYITNSVGGIVPVSNCEVFGQMIPGTSQLTVGCITCQQDYINVRGYCVANLTQSSYVCNVLNCVYCVQNNICGACAPGYTVFMGSTNQCTKNYSPYPNCLLTPLIQSKCVLCASGYILIDNQICYPAPSVIISCNISGCSFCILNNTCAACMTGYTLNQNGQCLSICNVNNCFQCASATSCQICSFGFYLNNSICIQSNNQPLSYCTSNFGPLCTQCSIYQCSTCTAGNTINPLTGQCCPSPVQNFANCQVYSIQWSSSNCSVSVGCSLCQLGSFLMAFSTNDQPQCVKFPCNIQNCAHCFNQICVVCNPGYNLINNVCQAYSLPPACTVPNCVSCNDNNQCTTCLSGYVSKNGGCVCNFQNCLACEGSAYCKLCAYPTVAVMASFSGCLPQSVPYTYCSIPNCMNCITVGVCGQCMVGYSLRSNGTCIINTCNRVNNCSLCNVNQTICHSCKQGYIAGNVNSSFCIPVSSNYSCLVQGCAVCNASNPNTCATCSPFYNLTTNGQCAPYNCIPNCIFCLSSSSCVVCQIGFYLTTSNACAPNSTQYVVCPSSIPNCIGCQTQVISGLNQTVCFECAFGLQPSADQLSCIPQTCSVPNCQICVQNRRFSNNLQMCFLCQQGFYLNSYYQCSQFSPALKIPNCSSIYNCIYCAHDNYCDYCAPNWNATNGTCLTNMFCSVTNCISCTAPNLCAICSTSYQLSSNSQACIPQCNITNCLICTNLTTCESCVGNLTLQSNACGCPDNTFNIANSSCLCPINTTLSSSNTTCLPCNIQNCVLCSSANQCQNCVSNLIVISNACSCPDSTFNLVNSTCICPQNFTPFSSTTGSTCIACNVTNCQNCSSANICQTCIGNLTVQNNICGCPDGTFLIQNNSCVCPINTTLALSNNTCTACNVTNCKLCSSINICQDCVANLIVDNNICSCRVQQTLVNQTCVECAISNCLFCSQDDVCTQCTFGFQVVNGLCTCPQNTTLYAGSCVPCNISNCVLCQQSNRCSICSPTFTLMDLPSVCVPCNVANCSSCSSPNYCSSCLNSLQVNAEGNNCVVCNILNCALCYNGFICAVCNPGYQLSKDATFCIKLCKIQGCEICGSNGSCTTCFQGYSLNANGSCSLCLAPCLTCNGPQACLTCAFPYSNLPATNGICYTCNVQNCFSCSSSNTYVCSQCQPNYMLSLNNTSCIYNGTCSINCAVCLLGQFCQTCNPGYTVSSINNTKCLQCSSPNCNTCSSTDITTCLSCSPGFYLLNGVCFSCPFPNCQTCNATACLTYQPSTNQIAFQFNSVIYPTVCDPGCAVCSYINPVVCIICHVGYTLTNASLCIPCVYPCLTCSYNSPAVCLTCYGNQIISGKTCLTCNQTSNCLTCSPTNASQCLTCPFRFNLNNGVCVPGCPQHCAFCSSATFCTTCVSGYSVNLQGVCLPCFYNCRVCSGTAQGLCLECGTGFYLSPGASGTCLQCPNFCHTCNYQGCIKCLDGYFLNQGKACSQNCLPPCANCLPSFPSVCTSCLAGYTYNSTANSCTVILTCPDGICYVCPVGYTSSINTCRECGPLSFCARCNPGTVASCQSCQAGYFLISSQQKCVSCPYGCQTCSSNSNCLTCLSGFTTLQQLVFSPGLCVQCITPCLTCVQSPITCTSCIKGYSLFGWNCQSTFNFGFYVTLNTTMDTFYTNYQGFIQALIAPLNSLNYSSVNMISISPNPVNVTGTLSTIQQSNSNEASTEYYSIQEILNSASIASMPILAASVYINGGQVPLPPDNINLALILGICIPLGVIFICVGLYVCLKKNRDPPIQYHTKFQVDTSRNKQPTQELELEKV